jgi:hypothetical protein
MWEWKLSLFKSNEELVREVTVRTPSYGFPSTTDLMLTEDEREDLKHGRLMVEKRMTREDRSTVIPMNAIIPSDMPNGSHRVEKEQAKAQ